MTPIVAGLAGAIITALVTIFINLWAKRGRVATSEAKDLWDTLRSELSRMQEETKQQRAEMAVARNELAALREEIVSIRAHASAAEERLLSCLERELELKSVISIKNSPTKKGNTT